MDEESVDFVYKYLVPQHLFKKIKCMPLFIITNTNPCIYRANELYEPPKDILNKKFSFVSSLVKFEDYMGGSFYLCNFIIDLKEMDTFRNPIKSPSTGEKMKMPFKHSHYSSPKKIDVENGLKVLNIPTRIFECAEYDVLSIKNKKKLKYSDQKSIIYEWLLKK